MILRDRVKTFLLLLCGLLLTASLTSLSQAEEAVKKNTAIESVPRCGEKDQWWIDRQDRFNQRIKQGDADLLMIGDSITHGWEGAGKAVWQKYYAKRSAVNLGIGGDRTQHVLWRLDNGNLEGISPKLAVVMIGTNNARDNQPEETAEGIKQIVEKLRKKLPKTKVLLLGIFPRGETNEDVLRKKNIAVNQIIQKLDDGKNVFYFDFGDQFLTEDGTLSKEVMPDLLHLNSDSYVIWAEAIEPYVAKYVGGEPDSEEGFAPLFDGKTLDGWHQEGGSATYEVKEDMIVGTVNPKAQKNTFLCTDKTYANFVLKLEVKMGQPTCNSGIQIRSHLRPNGTVFGYQCELDPSERSWSGGIYDESRRGWLSPLKGDECRRARATFNRNDWNTVEIRADGTSIQTWINGVQCSNLKDDKDAEGFIGLQVHTGKEGQVFWRKIRIKELPKSE